MTYLELCELKKNFIEKYFPYQMIHWSKYNYGVLGNILYRRRSGRGSSATVNNVIIMADTETSKKNDGSGHNHVVAWTISIRAFNTNIVTLYGHKPSSFTKCIKTCMEYMQGEETIVYFHNLSYDIVFLEKFLFRDFGVPVKQLNTKPHYPILLQFQNGLILKDSLILAQRNLEKWANDLEVEHRKAVGCWDYDKLRNQNEDEDFTEDELKYIEFDTLAGVECLQKTMDTLHKQIWSMPYTATGIPREEVRKRAKENNGRNEFLRKAATYEQYVKLTKCYHGGYTHANRFFIDTKIDWGITKCFDFASSYPYCMLTQKSPCTRFMPRDDCTPEYICENSDNYAYIFKFIALDIELKDLGFPMPALQFSKCINHVNAVLDNGRILQAGYVEIYLTELDLLVIKDLYRWSKAICVDVEVATKALLPKWFRDYVYECFYEKTMAKGGDPVEYSIKKAKVNSLYGLTSMKNIRDNYLQNFETMEYYIDKSLDPEESYAKFIKNNNSILLYSIGVYVTSAAFYNLYQLGKCCGEWIYSDTDSCYGMDWDMEKVNEYNENCKKQLIEAGYGAVVKDGREYWLGVAESEGENDEYTEFKVMGAKRYCGRNKADGELHITVAGVPKKKGALCLKDDINNFTMGLIFDGNITGKLLHTYYYVDEIYIDENGNETGDSIDLSPCDYLLDSVKLVDFDSLYEEEIEVQVYEEE